MKILLAGYGSIGRKHAEIIQRHNIADVYIAEPNSKSAQDAALLVGEDKVFPCAAEALAQHYIFDIAMVTTQTNHHIQSALEIADGNIRGLFIEKPLSESTEGIDRLIKKCEEKKIITMVGCNMRFYPTIAKMKDLADSGEIGRLLYGTFRYGQYLPACRPGTDYRETYSASREKGGGIILDDIHEIDLACYFMGDPSGFNATGGRLSKLEMTAEDFASVNIRFRNGSVGHILMDYIHPLYRRSLELVGTEGALRWNEDHNKVLRAKHGDNGWTTVFELKEYDYYDIYLRQIRYMIDCVENNRQTMNELRQAERILKLTLNIRQSVHQEMDGANG